MKVKIVSVGKCEKCGSEFTRPVECSHAVCNCCNPSPTFVPLQPALVLPDQLYKRYEQISKLTDVPIERLVNAVLEVGVEKKLKEISIVEQRKNEIG